VIEAINILCDRVLYLWYAYNKVRQTQAFFLLASMDSLEVSMSTMADTRQCPSCAAPHNMLDSTEKAFPTRDMQTNRSLPSSLGMGNAAAKIQHDCT